MNEATGLQGRTLSQRSLADRTPHIKASTDLSVTIDEEDESLKD